MNEELDHRYPVALRVLGVLLIVYALLDYFATYGIYAELRNAGVPHRAVGDLSLYPRESAIYWGQHLIAVVGLATAVSLWMRHSIFPVFLVVYYASLVTLTVASYVSFRVMYGGQSSSEIETRFAAQTVGAIIRHTILCVPWIVYVFKSKRVRSLFCLDL